MWQPNRLETERLEKIERLEAMGVEAYPRRVRRTHTAAAAVAAYTEMEAQQGSEAAEGIEVTVCGRIRRVNIKGKLSFLHIEDESGRVQLFLRVNDME
ncbi:MAG: lysine--tRNA ligase, partial [Anaerolineae bacterium]|nr:lysine--tRNA ligase [Anaerolineae bacterium]